MINLRIDVEDLGASALLRSMLTPQFVYGANQVAGRAAANVLKQHLRGLDRDRPNKMGARRSHFYSLAAQAVQHTVDDGGALVSVAHLGLAQRFYGGTIKPVGHPYLSLPAQPDAYGRRPRDSDNPPLSFVYALHPMGGWRPALATSEDQWKAGKVRKDGTQREKLVKVAGDVWYWLVRSVTQKPDPTVLPDESEINTAAMNAVESYIARHSNRANRQIEE